MDSILIVINSVNRENVIHQLEDLISELKIHLPYAATLPEHKIDFGKKSKEFDYYCYKPRSKKSSPKQS